MKKSSGFDVILTYAAVILLVLIEVLPFLWIFMVSIKHNQDIVTWPPKFIFKPTFQNYKEVLTGIKYMLPFVKCLTNSIITTGVSLLAAMTIASISAYSITRLKPRGSFTINLIILGIRMVPPIVLVVPLYIIYNYLGLIDTKLGLIFPFTALSIPLAVWIMGSFFLDIPKNIEEAAMIDGCSPFQAFWRVILPIAAPGLAAASIFSFILTWNNLTFPLTLTMSEAATLTVLASQFRTEEGILWGQLGAVSIIMMLPIIFFTIFATKYLVKGIASGAMKG